MRTLHIASASVAVLALMALYDAGPAEARGGHGGGRAMSFSAPRMSLGAARVTSNKTFVKSVTKTTSLKRAIVHKPLKVAKIARIDKGLKKSTASSFVNKTALSTGKMNLGKLPMHKAVLGKANLVGRLSVPKNLKPKLALMKAPNAALHVRLAPFLQRHWRGAYFWVAVAGVGYLTVPELYYDRFYRCANVDDPDYETCIRVLSYAVIEEEDEARRVRYPMPTTATYRYTATGAPTAEATQTCSMTPFVERKWNREFVWVQIPQTGNVTVPEEYYDRFTGKMGTEPPDYAEACKVLAEAAAADSVVAMASPDLNPRL
jgi:hypothetical protein